MRNRVLLAAGTLAVFVPTLLLAQQRPAQPAQPAQRPAQQPAQRPAAQPAQRPAAQPAAHPMMARMPSPHREGSWELTAGVGAFVAPQGFSATGSTEIMPGGTLRIGYNLNEMWNISVGTGLGFGNSGPSKSSGTYLTPGADITWTPNINAKTAPFIMAGVGLLDQSTPSANAVGGQVGVGIRHFLSDALALRIEASATVAQLRSVTTAGGIATVGLSYFAGGRKVLTTVAVTPGAVTLASLGQTQPLSARALDQKGNPMEGKVIRWSSNNPAVTVSQTGVVTAARDGSATISATSEGVTGTTMVTVARTAASVLVTPATATLAAIGATQAFTATAKDANNNQLMGPAFTWTSSDARVATVDASGNVTAVSNGTARITAATGGRNGSVTVTVAQATASVGVTPATSQLSAAGATSQLSAQAMDANGRPIMGKTFTWTSDATGVATVSATGLVTGVANGAAHVMATADGKSGNATVTVAIAPKGAPPVELPTLPTAGAAMVLKNVNFKQNSAVLLPAAMADLDKVAIAIQATSNSKWEIGGYTSSRGTAAVNLRLSQRRATAVKAYLQSKGVPAASLTAVGYGAAHPVASNKTRAGQAQNMRVEIKRLQ